MKQLIERIEELGNNDAVVFGWANMKRKAKNLSDEDAIVHLIKGLILSKNMAIRVLDKQQQDQKVVKLRK